MKAYHLKKVAMILCLAASFMSVAAVADTVELNATASTQVTGVPKDFNTVQFVLMEDWYFGPMPSFAISSTPVSQTMSVDSGFNTPALELTDNTPGSRNRGLTWFYPCNGLTLNYNDAGTNSATVVFTGVLASAPSYGVTCTCSGSACSTTAPVHAQLEIK